MPKISALFRRANIDRELPLTFQNTQGLSQSVKKAMIAYTLRNAKESGVKGEKITKLRTKFEGRSLLKMYQEVIQAEEVLNMAKQLDTKGKENAELIQASENAYTEGVKLLESSLHKYNEVATNSKQRDPLKDSQVSEQLEDAAAFIAFSSIHLNEVLRSSLQEGDVAALNGFTQRARVFAETITTNSISSPMSDAISQILTRQGMEFKNTKQQKEEIQRQKRLQQEECG